jgi:hypothetical protein
MLNVNKKTDKKLVNSGWGGHREKAGRKPTWNQKETTTIDISGKQLIYGKRILKCLLPGNLCLRY